MTMNELRAIVVHERDDDDGAPGAGRRIVEALRDAGLKASIHWRTQGDFEIDLCRAPILAIVHASNEDADDLTQARDLVYAFVGRRHVEGSRYAELGKRLREVGAEAVVVVSDEQSQCKQLVDEQWDGMRLLFADTERIICRTPQFVAALRSGSGAPLPRKWFYSTPDPTDARSALTILCQAYLAAHADPGTGEPDVAQGSAREACRAALKQMRWYGHRREDGVLRAELWTAEGREGVARSLDRESFWSALTPEDLTSIEGSRAAEPEVRALVASIRRGTVVVEGVARAYLAMTGG